jgi:hypothetical protein
MITDIVLAMIAAFGAITVVRVLTKEEKND